jgi:hypothetical protein
MESGFSAAARPSAVLASTSNAGSNEDRPLALSHGCEYAPHTSAHGQRCDRAAGKPVAGEHAPARNVHHVHASLGVGHREPGVVSHHARILGIEVERCPLRECGCREQPQLALSEHPKCPRPRQYVEGAHLACAAKPACILGDSVHTHHPCVRACEHTIECGIVGGSGHVFSQGEGRLRTARQCANEHPLVPEAARHHSAFAHHLERSLVSMLGTALEPTCLLSVVHCVVHGHVAPTPAHAHMLVAQRFRTRRFGQGFTAEAFAEVRAP